MLPIILALITVASVAFISYTVFTRNKLIGAFAQIGELQEREAARENLAASSRRMSVDGTAGKADKKSLILMQTKDKLAFTVGVVNVGLTMFLLGKVPTQFYIWHSPKTVLLIFLRWLDFRKKKQHYLLFDFCYWANFLLLLYVWVFPENSLLFQIAFLCSVGPLSWSVLAFNQAMIFHSWQHVTSVHIHVSPMLLTFGLRWYPDSRFVICDDPPACQSVSAGTLMWNALTKFYIWWIVLYYVWVFLVLGSYIQRNGFQTLYDRVTTKGPMSFVLKRINAHHLIKKAVYISLHLVFGVLTMALACVFWYSFWAHMVFLGAICTASVWNAASFYFEAFSPKYDKLQVDSAPSKSS